MVTGRTNRMPCWLLLLCLCCLPAQAVNTSSVSDLACIKPSPLKGSQGCLFCDGFAMASSDYFDYLDDDVPCKWPCSYHLGVPCNWSCCYHDSMPCNASGSSHPAGGVMRLSRGSRAGNATFGHPLAFFVARVNTDLWNASSWDDPWSAGVQLLQFDFHFEILPHLMMWSLASAVLLGRAARFRKNRHSVKRKSQTVWPFLFPKEGSYLQICQKEAISSCQTAM